MEWLKDKKSEYIICAAIYWNDGKFHQHQPKNILSGIVSCGRRHHNCFILLSEAYDNLTDHKIIQGFITSKDLFVTREQAHKIAFVAGQVSTEEGCLFSEDLY